MECPNCTFQNTPGSKVCVRCQSLVDFSGVDVLPPRAADGRMTRRVRSVAAAARFGMRDGFAGLNHAIRIPSQLHMTWSDLAWSLIPGLAQVHRGHRLIGWTILGVWMAVLVAAALNFGTGFGLMLCFAALSVHCFAISLVLAAPLQGFVIPVRLAIGLGLYLALLFAMYRPMYLMGRRVVSVLPVQGVRVKEPFANGDVLLYTGAWSRPAAWERGDLVVFEIPKTGAPGVIIRPGFGVDRIVGLPGDHVKIDGPDLIVNDEVQPEELCPVHGIVGMPPLDVVAGPEEYIVLPSALRWQFHGRAEQLIQAMMLTVGRVPESRLLGKVMWRVRPWSKFGPV